jgi:hypothetical protein
MTVTGTPQIILTNNSATARTITPRASNEANSISFRITAGTGTLTLTAGLFRDLDFTDGINPTGYAGALGNATITIYGNFKASTGMTKTAGNGIFTFAATSGTKTITTAAVVFDNPFTFDGIGGTWQLQDALTIGSTRNCTLTNGTLNLSSYTLTTGIFSSSNSNIRTLAFGTGNITLTGVNATIFNTTTVTNMTITGTAVVNCVATTGTSVQTRTLTVGPHGEAQAISVNINPGTSAVDIFRLATTSSGLKDVTFSSTFTGTIQIANGIIVYGNFDVGGTTAYLITTSSQIGFYATSGTQNINFRSLNFGTAAASCTIVFGSASSTATYLLTNGFTSLSTAITPIALNAGTLDLNNQTLTATSFSSSGGTARTLAMGTGKIVITGNNGTVCSTNTGTNLTITGSKRVELAYSGSVGQRSISGVTLAQAIEGTNLLDYFITAGTDIVNFNGARSYGTIDFSNGGTSTFTTPGSWLVGAVDIYGNLILNSTMGITGATVNVEMRATSGTKTITSAGQTMDFGLNINGLGGTFACSDALTLNSTRALSLVNGTLQLKASVTSTVGSFVTSGTTQKFLQSTLSGTQATISQASGTVSVSYLTIQDSNATGGATFNAYPYNFNSDAGNNTGWNGLSISDFAIGNVGTVGFEESFALTGVTLTGAVGTVTNGERTVALIGINAVGKAGNLGYYYWDVINDDQTANWAQINNANTPSWADINNTETANWEQIVTF